MLFGQNMSALKHDQRIRKWLKENCHSIIHIVEDYGRVDTSETSKDYCSLSQGFKCHKGTVEALIFFERDNECGFIEKKLHITKKFVNPNFCYAWIYNPSVHNFREYKFCKDGKIYKKDGKAEHLSFLTTDEWKIVCESLIDFLQYHQDEFKDCGHVSPYAERYLQGVLPQAASINYSSTQQATYSLIKQRRENYKEYGIYDSHQQSKVEQADQITQYIQFDTLLSRTNNGKIKWHKVQLEQLPMEIVHKYCMYEIWQTQGKIKCLFRVAQPRKTETQDTVFSYFLSDNVYKYGKFKNKDYKKLHNAIQNQIRKAEETALKKRKEKEVAEEKRAKEVEAQKRREKEELKKFNQKISPMQKDVAVQLKIYDSVYYIQSMHEASWRQAIINESSNTKSQYILEPMIAMVDVLQNDGTVVQVKIMVYYHSQNHIYYSLESEVRQLLQLGTPVCRIIYYSTYYRQSRNSSIIYCNSETLLHRLGYHVGMTGISEEKRHRIVQYALNNNVCTWRWLVNHLRTNILRFRTRSGYSVAVSEWENDLLFVKEWVFQSETEHIYADTIRIPKTYDYN